VKGLKANVRALSGPHFLLNEWLKFAVCQVTLSILSYSNVLISVISSVSYLAVCSAYWFYFVFCVFYVLTLVFNILLRVPVSAEFQPCCICYNCSS